MVNSFKFEDTAFFLTIRGNPIKSLFNLLGKVTLLNVNMEANLTDDYRDDLVHRNHEALGRPDRLHENMN